MKHYCKNGDEIKVGGVYATNNGQHPVIAVTSIDSVNMFPIRFPSRKGKGRQNGMAADTVTRELPRDIDGYYLWQGKECPVPGEWAVEAVTLGTKYSARPARDYEWDYVSRFRVISTGEDVQEVETSINSEQVAAVNALDIQEGGDHYKKMKIQPMEFSMANGLDACQHTIVKYVCRFRDKNGIEDLRKAKHCIDLLIQFEYGE